MRFFLHSVALCGIALVLIGCGQKDSAPNTVGSSKPSLDSFSVGPAEIIISRETTFVTEPLTEDGAIDLVAAINAKYSEGVMPEQNAVVLLYEATGPQPDGTRQPEVFFERMGVSAPPEEGNYFSDFAKYLMQSEWIDEEDPRKERALDELSRAMARPWKRAELARIHKWLDANETALNLVVKASRRPKYFTPVVLPGTERVLLIHLPQVRVARELARALVARAMLHLGEGRSEAAWDDLLAGYRLGRLIGQGPTLLDGLVGVALDAVVSGGILTLLEHIPDDPALLQQIALDLENAPPLPKLAETVDFMERLIVIDFVLIAAAESQKSLPMFTDNKAVELLGILQQPSFPAFDWNAVLRSVNQRYAQTVVAMREKEYPRRKAALETIEEDLKTLGNTAGFRARVEQAAQGQDSEAAVGTLVGEMFVAFMMPSKSSTQQAEDRAVQRQENLHVALALARFRTEHGRYPEQLTELAPKYLSTIPGDLFSGQPLKYASADGGYLLYSVGANGEDDGGRTYNSQPPGDDLVVKTGETK